MRRNEFDYSDDELNALADRCESGESLAECEARQREAAEEIAAEIASDR